MTSSVAPLSVRARARRVLSDPLTYVVIAFLAVSVFATATLPWKGTADAYDHLDYVFQVWSGHLPQPLGHEWRPDGWVLTEGQLGDGRQFASAHPPLYYLFAAGLAGPILDSDHWRYGVLLLRSLNTAIGLGGLFVLAWAGSMLGGRHARVLRIALPAVGAFTFAYLRFSTDTYNDIPVTVLSMVAIVVSVKVLRGQLTVPWYLLLVLTCTAGMGTKATFALTLAAACAATFIGSITRAPRPGVRSWAVAGALAGGLAAAPAAAFGWFYVRNVQLSGSWYRSTPKTALGGRSDKSLLDNLTNPDFYGIVPTGLIGRGTAEFATTAELLSLIIFSAGAILSIVAILQRRKAITPSFVGAMVVALIVLHLVGSYVLQLSHATGYGAYNWRYFLPSTITIALVIIGGAALLGRAAAWIIPLFTAALSAINGYSFVIYKSAAIPGGGSLSAPRLAMELAAANGIPSAVPLVAVVVAAAAIMGIGLALHRMLSQPDDALSADPPAPTPR